MIGAPLKKEFIGYTNQAMSINTMRKMREVIISSSKNPQIRLFAEKLIENVPSKDEIGEMYSVWNFLKTYTRYAKDPRLVEYIQTPSFILTRISLGDKPSLDCDDYTTLALTLLSSLGYKVAIRIAGYNQNREYEHVYGIVYISSMDNWMTFDASKADKEMGWEPPNAVILSEMGIG